MDPITMAIVGGQLGINVLGGIAQHGQAKAAYQRQKKLNAFNTKRIRQDLNASYADSFRRAFQEMVSLRSTLEDDAREAMRQRGTAITASGEAGVEGLSVDMLLADMEAQSARGRDRQTLNYEFTLQELARERELNQRSAESAIQNLPQARRPNAGLAVLGLASSSLESVSPSIQRYAGASGGTTRGTT